VSIITPLEEQPRIQTTNQKKTTWHTQGEEGFVGASGVDQSFEETEIGHGFVHQDEG